MGLILAGILASVLLIWLVFQSISKDWFDDDFCITLVLLLFGLLGGPTLILFGVYVPVSGYGESQIFSTTELVSLRDDTVSVGTYISISGINSYTYYAKVDSPYTSNSSKAYKSITLSNSNVTIVEDDSYTDAKLVTYVRYGKKSFLTLAIGAKTYEYVFYVPPGTIAQDMSLG